MPAPLTQEEMRKAIEAFKETAMVLYDMMDLGMSIVISLPEPKAIITPGHPPKMRTMVISKPVIVMSIGLRGVA